MPENPRRISSLFEIKSRFLRSTHLVQDFESPYACHGYVLTDFTKSCLERLAEGLKPDSTRRAWRLTGDYGSGKSCFALVMTYLFSGRMASLPRTLQQVVNFAHLGCSTPHLVPVLITGSREPLGFALLVALRRAIYQVYPNGSCPDFTQRLTTIIENKTPPSDHEVVELVTQFNDKLRSDLKGDGLLIVLDELGKFLEFAALHPQRQDIYLLQQLAEVASRSGNKPLYILGILHQGFGAYADQLDRAAQREWEKIAGRFDELLFHQSLEHITELVGSAMGVDLVEVPSKQRHEAIAQMRFALDQGWFGSVLSMQNLLKSSPSLFPLDPIALPVLVRVINRFGQNERSIFNFLQSSEPFGIQAFSRRTLHGSRLYKVHDIYDYIRSNLGQRLNLQSVRTHWSVIDQTIQSHVDGDDLEVKVLKTVGVLNLLDANDLLPTADVVVQAIAGTQANLRKRVFSTIDKLKRTKRVLYDRGISGGFCLWPHTSVDLHKAYERASDAIGEIQTPSTNISEFLDPRPIVARRHYIKTGNLRYFSIHYLPATKLDDCISPPLTDADGAILVVLCDTQAEWLRALSAAQSNSLAVYPAFIVAIPTPLHSVAGYLKEALYWDWLATNTLELNTDPYAREEVSRQKAAARANLEGRIKGLVDLRRYSGHLTIDWFSQGKPLTITTGRELVSYLSEVCEQVYSQAPNVKNELINRRRLSSAAAAARMRLIGRMLEHSSEPNLGMPESKRPPEMSVYLSILKNGNIHIEENETWQIQEPPSGNDPCRLSPTLRRIDCILRAEPDRKVVITDIFAELRNPPYGVREGLAPLILAIYVAAYRHHLAIFEDGTFLSEVKENDFLRLIKEPGHFEVQYCRIEGVRAEVFARLIQVLGLGTTARSDYQLLDVVQPLCVFVSQLPEYVLRTKNLSDHTIRVRDAILRAREPSPLLFRDLPRACGLQVISAGTYKGKLVEEFTDRLNASLVELKHAYPQMLERLKEKLREDFEVPNSYPVCRAAIAARAKLILIAVTEPQLKAFCLRLADQQLSEAQWVESVVSFIVSKPPLRWLDTDELAFQQELHKFVTRFGHVENIVFGQEQLSSNTKGIRLSITQDNGLECAQVLYCSPDEETVLAELQQRIHPMLEQYGRLGLAAVSRAVWEQLNNSELP